MTKHIHEAVPNQFIFTLCKKCKATACHQKECSVCGKVFCEVCQENRLQRRQQEQSSSSSPTIESANLSVKKVSTDVKEGEKK